MYIKNIDEEEAVIINEGTGNNIVFNFNKNCITEFNNIIVTGANELLLSDSLYNMYKEFEGVLSDITC